MLSTTQYINMCMVICTRVFHYQYWLSHSSLPVQRCSLRISGTGLKCNRLMQTLMKQIAIAMAIFDLFVLQDYEIYVTCLIHAWGSMLLSINNMPEFVFLLLSLVQSAVVIWTTRLYLIPNKPKNVWTKPKNIEIHLLQSTKVPIIKLSWDFLNVNVQASL